MRSVDRRARVVRGALAALVTMIVAAPIARHVARADEDVASDQQPSRPPGKLDEEQLEKAGMVGTPDAKDPRAYLDQAFVLQEASAERARATVADKLAAATVARNQRLRSAYRALISDSTIQGSLDEHLALARRRAAARYLLARDRHETTMLADEQQHLADATTRIEHDRSALAGLELPSHLGWPADGKVVRSFGPLLHERSRAVLSRRGIDIETEDDAQVRAAAAGVVRYAGPIRGLDDGVVIDHGTYFTVTAKLYKPGVHAGSKVTRGQTLGHTMRHRVYFEVRVKLSPGGVPIDPALVLPDPEPAGATATDGDGAAAVGAIHGAPSPTR